MVSGGADSMALLTIISDFAKIVSRVIIVHHCHHGVDENADKWLEFVELETLRFGFLFQSHYLELKLGPEFEARARKARYRAVMKNVSEGDVVMTAHHRDDQIETLLIRLSQGSGFIGLAGITSVRSFGDGVLARPLLSLTRKNLIRFLMSRKQEYIIDSSNKDLRFLRNFVRLRLLPALSKISLGVKDELIMLSDLSTDHVSKARKALGKRLPISGIDSVDLASTVMLVKWQIRFFAQLNGQFSPSTMQITEFARQCLEASKDRQPVLAIGDGKVKIKKWNQKLYWVDEELLGKEPNEPIVKVEKIGPNQSINMTFPNGVLYLQTGATSQEIHVYWGVKGCAFRLGLNQPRQSLKKLAKSFGIPPWYRRRIPLLVCYDSLVGWGDTDCRSHSVSEQSLVWEWRFVPRNKVDSSVS